MVDNYQGLHNCGEQPLGGSWNHTSSLSKVTSLKGHCLNLFFKCICHCDSDCLVNFPENKYRFVELILKFKICSTRLTKFPNLKIRGTVNINMNWIWSSNLVSEVAKEFDKLLSWIIYKEVWRLICESSSFLHSFIQGYQILEFLPNCPSIVFHRNFSTKSFSPTICLFSYQLINESTQLTLSRCSLKRGRKKA